MVCQCGSVAGFRLGGAGFQNPTQQPNYKRATRVLYIVTLARGGVARA